MTTPPDPDWLVGPRCSCMSFYGKIRCEGTCPESRMTTPHDDHPSLTTPPTQPEVCEGRCRACGPHYPGPVPVVPLVELRLPARRPPILVDTEAAAVHASRPVTVIYRWANEGRLTRHGTPGKGNARWDLREIPAWSGEGPRPAPPPVQAKNFQDRA